MKEKKITLFAGHYGSGKTTIAVQYALWLRKRHEYVAIADLDVVNPYFRTKDAAQTLSNAGIKLIGSDYANTNLDAPAMPAETMRLFDEPSVYGVIDVGGDDRGSLAIGKYARYLSGADTEKLLVINRYRPLTQTAAETALVGTEIERAARFSFTGIVNNSNLGTETTKKDVLSSLNYANEVSKRTGLPIVYTTLAAALVPALTKEIPNLMGLQMIEKRDWRL